MLIRLVCDACDTPNPNYIGKETNHLLQKVGGYSTYTSIEGLLGIQINEHRHPLPVNDLKWLDANDSEIESIESVFAFQYLFAFKDTQQMLKWFCYDELKTLEKFLPGFEYQFIESEVYFYSKHQAIFDYTYSKIVK